MQPHCVSLMQHAEHTVRCALQSMEQVQGVRLNGTSSTSPPTNGTGSPPLTPTSPVQPEPGASKPVPIPGAHSGRLSHASNHHTRQPIVYPCPVTLAKVKDSTDAVCITSARE